MRHRVERQRRSVIGIPCRIAPCVFLETANEKQNQDAARSAQSQATKLYLTAIRDVTLPKCLPRQEAKDCREHCEMLPFFDISKLTASKNGSNRLPTVQIGSNGLPKVALTASFDLRHLPNANYAVLSVVDKT